MNWESFQPWRSRNFAGESTFSAKSPFLRLIVAGFAFFSVAVGHLTATALSNDELKKLRDAGVDEQTIQRLIELEETDPESLSGMGVKEVTRPDGRKTKTYFSGSTPEEDARAQQEEQQKVDRALEILRYIIIAERRR